MRVLITGSGGFVASGVIEALLGADHEVVRVGRSSRGFSQNWAQMLVSTDAVINCAGILRESRAGDFDAVHVIGPTALAEACRAAGVAKFIQISALGDPRDGEFIASKHRFDHWLLATDLDAVVIRPSVVVSTRGSYGGTSMLRALAAIPGLLLLPGDGNQPLQPVLIEDLSTLVLTCLQPGTGRGRVLYAVGPERMSLRDYLLRVRAWLQLPAPRVVAVPVWMVRIAARAGERFGRGPLGLTMLGMLERGNVASTVNDTDTGWRPQSVSRALDERASYVQDRWHARLYFVAPAACGALAVIWLVSGAAGLLAPESEWRTILTALGIPDAAQGAVVIALSALNLMLGIALLVTRAAGWVLKLMLVAVAAYTGVLGMLSPGLWMEPFGGLVKNLAVIVLVLVALATREGR